MSLKPLPLLLNKVQLLLLLLLWFMLQPHMGGVLLFLQVNVEGMAAMVTEEDVTVAPGNFARVIRRKADWEIQLFKK